MHARHESPHGTHALAEARMIGPQYNQYYVFAMQPSNTGTTVALFVQ